MSKTPGTPSILFLNRVVPPEHGATGRLLFELIQYCINKNWRVSLITLSPDPNKVTPIAHKNFTHHLIKHAGGCRDWMDAHKALQKIKRVGKKLPDHDIVVSMTDPPMLGTIGEKIAKAKKAKHIHWVMDVYPDLLPALKKTIHPFIYNRAKKSAKKMYQKSSRIVVLGRCMREHISNQNIDQQKIEIIPNWANDVMYKQSKTPIEGQNKFRVLYAGNMGSVHRVKPILYAVKSLNKTNPEIEFVFVGNAKGHRYFMKQRERLQLENIRFLPFQPEEKLKALLEFGDIHLISMKEETLGMVVPSKLYSVMAAGRPTVFIGPEKCETGKLIKEYECGDIIDHKKPEKLVDAILSYRTNPDRWFNAQKGTVQACQKYSKQNSLKQWGDLLHTVLKEDG